MIALPFHSRMTATEGKDARLLATAVVASALGVALVGLSALAEEAPFALTMGSLVPPLLGAAGFLVIALVVDPLLTPKTRPTPDEVHVWLSKSFMCRLPAIELPALAGLVLALAEQERSVLLMGVLSTLVLAMLWWPGEQFFGAMRRRLQPLSADRLMDELLTSSNGRLHLRTR